MSKKTAKLTFLIIVFLCIGGVVSVLWAESEPSEILLNTPTRYYDATFDLGKTRKEASVKRKYSPVPFNHELHMGALKCTDCHHDKGGPKNNKIDEALLVTGNPAARCVTCHNLNSNAKVQKYYHGSCLDCHEKLKKQKKPTGPELCAGCHVPQKVKKYQ